MIKKVSIALSIFFLVGICCGIFLFFNKYRIADEMLIPVEEVTTAQYSEDPAHRSVKYDRYNNRSLKLVKKDDCLFDFTFFSEDPAVATITVKDVDLKLFVPIQPEWTRSDPNLEIIALTDREWNRQQVSFSADSKHIEIVGGDGFEQKNIHSIALARNCLNAGLWEVILNVKEDGKKSMYYQGWFTFPLGHYKSIFEELNSLSYWKHWYRLEHWWNPQGKKMDLSKLRTVINEEVAQANYNPNEPLVFSGEQIRKARTCNTKCVRTWSDYQKHKDSISFAAFVPPGRYSVKKVWGNQLDRISKFEKAIVRKIKSPAQEKALDEVELVFKHGKTGKINRFIVSGIDFDQLPAIPQSNYSKGLYRPMGISTPPFYQSYTELKKNPPNKSSYFSVLIDEDDKWINHHEVSIDGPVMHRDENDFNLVHIYLLSYERHALVGHYTFRVNES